MDPASPLHRDYTNSGESSSSSPKPRSKSRSNTLDYELKDLTGFTTNSDWNDLNYSPHPITNVPSYSFSMRGRDKEAKKSNGTGFSRIKKTSSSVKTKWKGVWRWMKDTDWDLGLDVNDKYVPVRAMKSRHMMMIAIGGTIGTGIFLSAGSAIALAGPGSALLSYVAVGAFVYSVVIALGEMASFIPVSGAFSTFGSRFVSDALGFTLGWNYWLQWSLSIPSELTAASVILQFWTPNIETWQWSLLLIVPIFFVQMIHVRIYGESEYWLSIIKVLLVILFIMVGLIYDWGGVKKHPGPGLSNWSHGQAFVGGFANFAQTFVYAFYSFGGIELVALAAGESVTPHRTVPRAVKATFFRIIIFYILTILTMGLCINYKDGSYLSAAFNSNVRESPLTVVFMRAGFGAAVSVVNAVLLTAVLSATNSCFYASSRMLFALAKAGQAPRIFGWVNSRGVPVPALMVALAVSFLTFLTTLWDEGLVFTWLLNLTGISALLVWASIGIISLRFRLAFRAQGRSLEDLPYTQPLFPLLPVGVMVMASLMFLAQGYASIRQDPFEAQNVVAKYIGVALYIIVYLSYTLYERFYLKKTGPYFIPLLDVDFDTDAVWKRGEGRITREREAQEREQTKAEELSRTTAWIYWCKQLLRHVY